MGQNAYVLRIAPGGKDKVPEALNSDQLIIGWAYAEGLIDDSLGWTEFRQIVSDTYYPTEESLRRAGAAGGHLWRFIREMNNGDLIVVPYGPNFYVAEVIGPAIYVSEKVDEDSAYRRSVRWLNLKQPISRLLPRVALQTRMSIRGTTADASDLVTEIKECLDLAERKEEPTFQSDLKARLIKEVLSEMREGRIDDYGFERLVQTVMLGLGASECPIIPRKLDKGADLIAVFRVAGAFQQRIAVQAKHWQPFPPVQRDVIDQLTRGVEGELADLGMVVTSGTISDDARQAALEYFENEGVRIELVDGEQLARLIVEHGIGVG